MLHITENWDEGTITVKSDNLSVEIPAVDFALMSEIYLIDEVPMTELCLCYQEQFNI